MSFFIKEVRLNAIDGKDSVVEFIDGVNFVTGPSNTGKSLINCCIDYCFGYVPRKNKNNECEKIEVLDNLFNAVTVTIVSEHKTAHIRRNIGENKYVMLSGDFGTKQLKLTGTKETLNAFLLSLINTDDQHKIRSGAKESASLNAVTWRAIQHFFYVKQSDIDRANSILYNTNESNTQYKTPGYFLFLLKDINSDDYKKKEKLEIRKAKAEAEKDYINQELLRLGDRYRELADIQVKEKDSDAIEELQFQLSQIQEQLHSAISESKYYLNEIYKKNSSIAENKIIIDQFKSLKSQYLSDIRRMSFIVDGETAVKEFPPSKICPLCGQPIKAHAIPTYSAAIQADINQLQHKISDLDIAMKDITSQQENLQKEVHKLEIANNRAQSTVTRLKSNVSNLKGLLGRYQQATRNKKEMELISQQMEYYRDELSRKQTKLPPEKTYDIKLDITPEIIKAFQDYIVSMLNDIHFPQADIATFDLNTFDVIFGGRSKTATMGGGYSSIINSVVILSFMQYLIKSGAHPSGFTILDSPLTALSESDYKKNDSTIMQGFYNYLANTEFSGQVIIFDKKDRIPVDISAYKNINAIKFTGDMNNGRSGFIQHFDASKLKIVD